MPSIAFIVAHPDDVAFGMGGTAALLRKDYDLHVLCACKGERGYKEAAQKGPSAELAAIREKEERAACDILGATLQFMGQMDGEIYADRAACDLAAAWLSKIKPAAVFTMGPLEKPDHAATFIIGTKALYLADLFWTTERYAPLFDGETYNCKYADLYVNIGSVVETKLQLMRCHKSQAPDEAAIQRFLSRNTALGRHAWCDYAEAYTTGLPLMAVRWKRKAGSILMGLTP